MDEFDIWQAVRAEIADAHEQTPYGMWGDYGEPMLPVDWLMGRLNRIWGGYHHVEPMLPSGPLLNLLDELIKEGL